MCISQKDKDLTRIKDYLRETIDRLVLSNDSDKSNLKVFKKPSPVKSPMGKTNNTSPEPLSKQSERKKVDVKTNKLIDSFAKKQMNKNPNIVESKLDQPSLHLEDGKLSRFYKTNINKDKIIPPMNSPETNSTRV